MNTIQDYFKQAELALGAYANLTPGDIATVSLTGVGVEFSARQADQFVGRWEVVEQFSPSSGSDTGLSATVFRERATGRTFLAVRGTELGDVYDLATDLVSIVGLGSTAFQGQYQGLKAKVQEWLANGTLQAGFSVAGHSLGGFLGSGLRDDFGASVGQIYTFNTPGIGGVGANLLQAFPGLKLLFAWLTRASSRSGIANLYADHNPSPAANLGVQLAQRLTVHIENQLPPNEDPNVTPALNHSMRVLTDALALYDAMARIDPGVALREAGAIVGAASRLSAQELERVTNELVSILNPSGAVPVPLHDRDALFTAVQALSAVPPSGYRFVDLSATPTADLARSAAGSAASRYALERLNSFALLGVDYTALNVAFGAASANYLRDRAELLSSLLKMNSQDVGVEQGGVTYFATGSARYFDDRRTGMKLVTGGSVGTDTSLIGNFAFGAEGDDALTGGLRDDRLYGNRGADTLIGGRGSDRLEGGEGADTYVIASGEGADTIVDSDGQGELRLGSASGTRVAGVVDAAGSYLSPLVAVRAGNTYELDGLTYSYRGDLNTGATLAISGAALGGSANSVTVEGFTNGALGIYLPTSPGIRLRPGYQAEIPAEQGGGLSASVGEGGASTFTLSTDVVADTDRVVRVAVDANGDKLSALLGASEASFASGFVDVTIPAGQNRASIAVRASGDFDAATSVNLSATLLGSAGPASTVALTVNGVTENDTPPTTTYTILGDQVSGPGSSTDAFGNIVNGVPAPDRNDILNGSPGNDRIEALGGDDFVTANEGDDHVLGGTGNDQLFGGAGADRIEGEAGRDQVFAGIGNDLVLGGADEDFFLGGDAGDDRVYAATQADEGAIFNSDAVTATPGSEWLDGSDGKDRLIAGTGADVLLGGAGEDLLAGGAGADTLYGDRDVVITSSGGTNTFTVGAINAAGAADFLHGGGGDDFLYGEVGADALLGAGGNDELVGDADGLAEALHGGDFLDGGDGDDRLFGQGGNDALFGGAGNDLLQADSLGHAPGDDYLSGEAGEDTLIGLGGRDVLHGGLGNDQLFGDSDDTPLAQQAADELFGGEGDDLLQGYGGDDLLDGGAGIDTVLGGLGKDRIFGGAGNDILTGDEGAANPAGGEADVIDGGEGDDQLFGQGGDDTLLGGLGADLIQAGAGNDTADGGAGNDVIFGEAGADRLAGGEGNDQLNGGENLDVIEGGAGDDFLLGEAGADTLFGNAGADRIQAGADDDNASGGEGNDLIFGESGNDVLAGDEGDDELQGGDGDDRLEGGAGDDFLIGGRGSDVIVGGPGNDFYRYALGDGVDTIVDSTAGGDSNTLQFGFAYGPGVVTLGIGSLKISVQPGDEIHIEGFDPDDPFAEVGVDRFEFTNRTLTYTELLTENRFRVGGTPEPDVLEGTVLDDVLDGLASDDVLIGKAGDDQLFGGPGADLMAGGEGDDTYFVEDSDDLALEIANEGTDAVNTGLRTYTLPDQVENLAISGIGGTAEATGNSLDNEIIVNLLIDGAALRGLEGDDSLSGTNGADLLDGGAGADTLAGGFGDDSYYVDEDSDFIVEFLDSGVDRVYSSSIAFDLQSEVEHLTLLEGSGAISGVGNLLDNTLTGNSGDNFLAGELQLTYLGVPPGVGNDLLLGMAGNDELDGWIGDDVLEGGAGDDALYGRAGVDLLRGGGGDDVLDGSTLVSFGFFGTTVLAIDDDEVDMLEGGTGNDTYVIGDADDVIVENPGEGEDWVEASIDFRLPENVENLDLVGDQPLIGEGNDEANYLIDNTDNSLFTPFERTELHGLGGDDLLEDGTYLDGGAGADVMIGRGEQSTTYVVDNPGDQVIEGEFGAYDYVSSSITLALPAWTEHLTLTGDSPIDGFGNELTNVLVGNDAANRLEDLAGSVLAELGDQLYGMGGDDTLLAAFGNSVLDGGAGVDSMAGGVGDDTYYVDASADAVFENADEGYDTVFSTATFTLADHVEELRLEGAADLDGFGGATANRIVGNAGSNRLGGAGGDDVLDGGAGADSMAGGTGDDRYMVENASDGVIETAGEGFDEVLSSVSFTLPEHVEAIVLQGPDAIDATGNADANTITGNDAVNVLVGLAGNDAIDGASGDDSIEGGDGDDVLFGGADASPGGGGTGGGDDECRGDDCPPNEGGILPNHDLIFGGAGDDAIDGGSGADELHGGEGDDFIYGGDPDGGGQLSDFDRLYGEAGDDTLDGGVGFDELYGGEGSDQLYGGSDLEGDYLDGGRRIDFMAGGAGGDTYVVDGTYTRESVFELNECGELFERTVLVFESDTVVENPFEGSDVVLASVSFTLPDNIEQLSLVTPTDPAVVADYTAFGQDGTGNALNNTIGGNNFANRLDGRGGNDLLIGGQGNDTYVIGSTGDQIFESGSGVDTVETTLQNYSLASNLENLTFLDNGSSAFRTGGGTGFANVMRGSGGRENLIAGFGDDTLYGGPGDDFLQGQEGNDSYRFRPGDGVDTIIDFFGFDTLHVLDGVAPEELVWSTVGSDVHIQIAGTADKAVLRGWTTAFDRVDQVVFCDGTVLDEAAIAALAAGNRPPTVAAPIPDQSTLEDAAYGFTVPAGTFSDPDAGDTLTLSAALADGSALPEWLSFSASGASFSGTPENEDVGEYSIGVTSTDRQGKSASDDFVLTVVNVNDTPLAADDAGAAQEDGGPVTLAAAALLGNDTDIDAGDSLSIVGAADSAGGAAVSVVSGDVVYDIGNLFQSLAQGATATDTFAYTIADAAGATASAAVTMTITGVNDAPQLTSPLADQFGREGESVNFVVPADAFSDVDANDVIAYSATLSDGTDLPAWLGFDAASGTFGGTPGFADSGQFELRVTATDAAGASASDTFTLTIAEVCNDGETYAGGHHDDLIVGGPCDDIVLGFQGKDALFGEGGDDILRGDSGKDMLFGGAGNDLLDGGNSPDELYGGSGTNLFIGGNGPDAIVTSGTNDVIAWNRGDGPDEVTVGGSGPHNRLTLSFGGGVRDRDVGFKRRGEALEVGACGDAITLGNWFALAPGERPMLTVQIVGADVRRYEVSQAVNGLEAGEWAGDAWREAGVLAVDPVTGAPQVIGGQPAYDYAVNGSSESLPETEQLAALNSAEFGAPQTVAEASPRDDSHDDRDGHEDRDRDDRGDHDRRHEWVSDWIARRLAHVPQFDFEAFLRESERGSDHPADSNEIARRWQAVARYTSALADEANDDERRGAPLGWHRSAQAGLFGTGGAGFGFEGSVGAARGPGELKSFEGLKEGFHKL